MQFPETVIFDLDGTLIDSAPDLTLALNHTLSTLDLPPVDLPAVRDMVGRGARVLIEKGSAASGVILDETAMEDAFQRFLAFYADHIADHTIVFDGVFEALDLLAKDGVSMGICTNKPQDLTDSVLDALDLTQYFDTILGADAVPNRKPHPDHLLKTIEGLGGNPASSVLVGDSITDVETARNAKVPVIAVRFGYSLTPVDELGADRLIDHFDALAPALTSLLDNAESARL
ncbi:MAG: phosphoglycolate phosphatase [Alphaproteobacteria bacterium]